MNTEEAFIELSFHSCRNQDVNNPMWENGFLGSLRPYRDMALVEENFHKVIACLKALSPYVKEHQSLDKSLVSDVSGVIHFGKSWGVHEDSMLRRNNLISREEACLLEDWIECISYSWATMLDTEDEATAFEFYYKQYRI